MVLATISVCPALRNHTAGCDTVGQSLTFRNLQGVTSNARAHRFTYMVCLRWRLSHPTNSQIGQPGRVCAEKRSTPRAVVCETSNLQTVSAPLEMERTVCQSEAKLRLGKHERLKDFTQSSLLLKVSPDSPVSGDVRRPSVRVDCGGSLHDFATKLFQRSNRRYTDLA